MKNTVLERWFYSRFNCKIFS